MDFYSLFTKPGVRPAALLCSTLIGGCLAVLSVGSNRTDASGGRTLSATHKMGTLRVTIPYENQRAGSGQLILEVLDPEDGVIGRTERASTITTGSGQWQETLKLAKALPLDDLVWHRLHYRFVFAGNSSPAIDGIEPLSKMLRIPDHPRSGATSVCQRRASRCAHHRDGLKKSGDSWSWHGSPRVRR